MISHTKRLAIIPLLVLFAGCPGDKKTPPKTPAIALDTTPANLDTVTAALPPAVPDTFTPPPKPKPARPRAAEPAYPPAPTELQDAVQREQSFSKFCYQEFGQKQDPGLYGGVAMVVTVGSGGVTAARVVSDSWSSKAGAAVNQCLDQRAKIAWKLAPGAVKPGKYVVRLTFQGS